MYFKHALQKTVLIIAAGGSGTRFGSDKLTLDLCGKPLFIHTIQNFLDVLNSDQIILVCRKESISMYKKIVKKTFPNNKITIIEGGQDRTNSVFNGLKKAQEKQYEYAVIHDAARPLAKGQLLIKCLKSLINANADGAIAAKKVINTIKVTNDKHFIATLNRSNLWSIETPQVFYFSQLFKAYSTIIKNNNTQFTDDAAVVEAAGGIVIPVEDNDDNLKITYKKDIALAEFILNQHKKNKIQSD